LYIDGKLVGNLDVDHTTPNFYELEGLSCGYDSGAPVAGDAYEAPFKFTGLAREVVIDITGELIQEDEETRRAAQDATMRRLMAQQ
jgi:arylsulfatase